MNMPAVRGQMQNYEALSYTCGPPVEGWECDHELIHLSGRSLNVIANLADALRRFRHPRRSRRLWVDALCINQEDNVERSQQVADMSHIYAKAFGVLVWLGKDDETNTGAIAMEFCKSFFQRPTLFRLSRQSETEYIQKWENWLQESYDGLGQLPDLIAVRNRDTSGRSVGVSDVEQHILPALYVFSQRRYFKRRWILQELFNARLPTVCCGNTVASWDEVEYAFKLLPAMYEEHFRSVSNVPLMPPFHSLYGGKGVDKPYRLLNLSSNEWKNRSLIQSLAERLVCFQESDCSDPRDRVYSLLGFGTGRICLEIDYSIEPTELWKQVSRALVRERLPYFSIEMAASQEPAEDEYLPSWMPDFNLPVSRYHRSWYTPNSNAYVDDQDCLHLEIYCFGKVVSHRGKELVEGIDGIARDVFHRFSTRYRRDATRKLVNLEGVYLVSTTGNRNLPVIAVQPVDAATIPAWRESCKIIGTASLLREKEIGPGESRWFCIE